MAYEKVFTNPYPDGWEDSPSEATPITASALQEHTDAIEHIEDYLENNPSGGASTWSEVAEKPFERIGTGLVVQDGNLNATGGGGSDDVEITKSEYDDLPNTKYTDGKNYYIKDWAVGSDGEAQYIAFDNSTTGIESDNVQGAIEEVFQSVSNGKVLIADAITGKGVETSATDTFAVMAANIESIPSGSTGPIEIPAPPGKHRYAYTVGHGLIIYDGYYLYNGSPCYMVANAGSRMIGAEFPEDIKNSSGVVSINVRVFTLDGATYGTRQRCSIGGTLPYPYGRTTLHSSPSATGTWADHTFSLSGSLGGISMTHVFCDFAMSTGRDCSNFCIEIEYSK